MGLLKNPKAILPVIVFLSLLLHWHVFKMDLVGIHVWRQTQTQINIENFYKEDFNILHPKTNERGNGNGILRQEFPVMQWGFACAYKVFGDHLVISRILSFILGIFSMFGIFFLIRNLFQNEIMGIIGAWAFNFSPVFYYYTMNPLPDNFALCCSIWGLALFFHWVKSRSLLRAAAAGIFLSLGSLAKLPFLLFIAAPALWFFIKQKEISQNWSAIFLLFAFSLAPLAWYARVIPSMQWNPVIFGITNPGPLSFSETMDILQFNLISTLPELLVNYGSMLFFLGGFYFAWKNRMYTAPLFKVLAAWALAVLGYFFFEMNLIAKVHDYYLFPFLPLIFITVGYGGFHLLQSHSVFINRFSFFLLLILPVTAFLRADSRWNETDPGFNRDLMQFKNELRKAVTDDSLCVVGNDESKNIFLYYVNKKGWSFDHDSLSAAELKRYISKGAKIIYSDSRSLEEKEEIKPLLGRLIDQRGSIKIFSLKK